MRRRALIGAAAALGSATDRHAVGQTAGRTFRLALLGLTPQSDQRNRELLVPELERHGFAVGRNLVLDNRHGAPEALPGLARAMLAGGPDAVVTIGSLATRAVREASASVPIVMFADDPVGLGFAASFARPGGNITGVANMVTSLQAKRLELLAEALPAARRMGALVKTSSALRAEGERSLRESATASRVELAIVYAETAAEYPAAFAALRAAGVEGLVIGADPLFYDDATLLAALAREARLPTSCEWADMAHAGCVLGYGPERAALRRRMADQIARIFRGTPPGEIPIEQPSAFEFAINLRVARALGVAVPQSLLQRANEVIE